MTAEPPDPLGVFLCGCCPEHRPKQRANAGTDCVVCPHCDSPEPTNPPAPSALFGSGAP